MKPQVKSDADYLSKIGNLGDDSVEGYRKLVNAQKEFIVQQKELIDWLKGQVVNSSLSPTVQQVPKQLKHCLKDKPTQFWLTGLLLAIMIISSLVLFFCLYNYGTSNPDIPTFGHDDNLGDDIQVIHRKEWLARDPLYFTSFAQAPKMVRILHSAGANCSDYQTCANKVLGLQGMHVGSRGLPDIAYNFMIGGDGNVYIGRGAGIQTDGRPDTIDIAYIGNYLAPYDKVTTKMDQAGRRLIERLLGRSKIREDYTVVAHNQTENVISPGDNVYRRIVSWPHYVSGLYLK